MSKNRGLPARASEPSERTRLHRLSKDQQREEPWRPKLIREAAGPGRRLVRVPVPGGSKRTGRISNAKRPVDYMKKRRLERAIKVAKRAKQLGLSCRHLEDMAASEQWAETGIWPKADGEERPARKARKPRPRKKGRAA